MADYRIRVFVDPSGAVAGSQTATAAVGRIGDAVDRVSNRSVPGLMSRLRGLGGAIAVGSIIAGAVAYARVSDEITTANSQMRLASRNQADLNRLQASSYQIAQRNGVAWGATANLLARTIKSARDMGMAWDRAAQLGENATRAVSAAVRVSGSGAQQAQAGILQLNQALASGTLRGDELNSVMENIPALGDAIARAMGRSAGELRRMGREGELTSAAVSGALERAMPELERLAALMPLTFSAAFQRVRNAFGQLVQAFNTEGVGVGGAIIASMDLIARALEFAARNASTLSNLLVGALVASLVRVAVSAATAGAAALATARANAQLATSAVATAAAQQAQARASLQVAIAMNAQGVATRAQVAQAAASLTASSVALGVARRNAVTAGASLLAAGRSASLMGRAFQAGVTVANAAIARLGGGIGLIIMALVSLLVWAGRAAAGFQPIAGEAGTVADYVAVAFEDATAWVSQKWGEMTDWVGRQLQMIRGYVRPVAVFIVDVFLGAARGVAGAASAIVAAWGAAMDYVRRMTVSVGTDLGNIMSGDFSFSNVRGAWNEGANIGDAFARGWASGTAAIGTATGESVVSGVENAIAAVPGMISDFARNSGYRERANQRAADRARAQNAGGDRGPGTPPTPDADDGNSRRAARQRTFQDILDEANEQARLAGMVSYEAERQTAIYQAQRDLRRDLTAGERELLYDAVALRQQNEADLRIDEARLDVQNEMRQARARDAILAARERRDDAAVVTLTAELEVQDRLNEARRAGVVLDEAKVEAYRRAVTYATAETEIIRLQAEARQALQAITDNARESMRTALVDGIEAALSGDIKGVGSFFKNLGQIMRRQLAETLASRLFAGETQARVDALRVTQQALEITTPAADAVNTAGQNLAAAIQGAADHVNAVAPPVTLAGTEAAAAIAGAGPDAAQAVGGLTGLLNQALGPLGSALSGIIGIFGSIFRGGGSGSGGGGLLSRLFRPSGSTTSGSGAAAGAGRLSGVMGKIGTGMMYGQLGGMVPGLFGAKTSSLGGSLGGIAGSFIGGPVGAAIGGAIGSLLGGMLKKAKTGTATIGDGSVTGGGNNAAMRGAAVGAGNTIMDRLREAAKALGGGVGSFGNITIGQRDGAWRVNTTGTSTKKKKGAKDFGEDAEAALEYAFQEAIRRGALTGLTAGVAAAIQSGAATIEEAVDFTAARKRISLEAIRLVDPIRAAVMEVDEEFSALKAQYEKFGESTVDLEKVYGARRKDAIEKAMQDQLGVIRDFIAELKGGTLGGASLTDRVSEQDRLFSAIEAAQAAGQTVDYDELNTVGRALIEATRELNGATPDFYKTVDRVMAVLEGALASGENPNVSTLPPPLWEPAAVADPIVGAINDNGQAQLDALNAIGQAIVRGSTPPPAAGGGGGGGSGGGGINWNTNYF